MEFRLLQRLVACALTPFLATLVSYSASGTEKLFWAIVSFVGMAAFLLVKPAVPIKKRIQMIGMWELMAPVVLIVFATVQNPAELQQNATRLVFIVVFFVGIGTAARILLWRDQQ